MICELLFPSSILAVKLNRKTLVIVLETEIYIYDISNMRLLHVIETTPNPEGQLGSYMFRAIEPTSELCYSNMCIITIRRELVPRLPFTCPFLHHTTSKPSRIRAAFLPHIRSTAIRRRPHFLHPLSDSIKRHPSAQIAYFLPLQIGRAHV